MSTSVLVRSWSMAALAVSGLLSVQTPAVAQTLTGLAQFSATPTGSVGGTFWTTHPSFPGHKLFVVRNADPTAGFLPGQPGISAGLGNGHHIFFIFGEPGVPGGAPGEPPLPGTYTGRSGLNLFFEGSSLPGISVVADDRTGPGAAPAFVANDGARSAGLHGESVVGANTLTTTSGGKQIVLSHYEWATPTAGIYNDGNNLNRVNGESIGGDLGDFDFVGKFELDVTDAEGSAVPEPGSLLLFLPALGVVAAVRRRRGS